MASGGSCAGEPPEDDSGRCDRLRAATVSARRLKEDSWLAIRSSTLASAGEAGGHADSGRPAVALPLLATDAIESWRRMLGELWLCAGGGGGDGWP